jgi:hypothetical protein
MAKNRRPSFLKRQKEQARKSRAEEKRTARRARRLERTAESDAPEPTAILEDTPEEIPGIGS